MPVAIPKFLKTAFAAVGIKNNIPDASDNVTGRAGYDKGFPEINMQPRNAGGIPPAGGDMNGVLYDLSAAIQYWQSGIEFPFDVEFADKIGGYSNGAIVSDAANNSILWINNIANNKNFPAGWTMFTLGPASSTIPGVSRLSTQTEVDSRTSGNTLVTPATMGNGLAFSIGVSSFLKLPKWMGGFIFQWGSAYVEDISGSIIIDVTFPTAFTSSTPIVVVSDDSTQMLNYLGIRNRTATTFKIFASENGVDVSSHAFNWFAVGV